MKVFYSPRYEVSLPGHIWPTSKYRLIADRLRQGLGGQAAAIIEPTEASWDDLALVHTAEYLEDTVDIHTTTIKALSGS